MATEYRVVIVGDGGVGKSALTIQFIKNVFVTDYDPTIEDSYRKQLCVDDLPCVMDILDTAGQEELSAMRDQYIRRGQGFLCVYSIASRSSFDEITLFRDQILRVKDSDSVPFSLCGNKSDLDHQRQVSYMNGLEMAKTMGCPFLETSAKTRTNVDEAFISVLKEIRKEKELSDSPRKKRGKACQIL
eukprot:TRINITY_DN287_c0_g1_i1.p1 TRINITY_DN287_c0_g1~~TRINITY_DN287_c0_g1_i1.p1  ORF type:complete len:187 (-),score=60.55 TRINITY_DN287_c0_g1_i1:25-585(-)